MALIFCPECNAQVSDKANTCPKCGFPFKSPAPVVVQQSSGKSRGTFIILGLLLGGLGIHNFYAGYYGQGACQLVLSGIAVTASGLISASAFTFVIIWILVDLFTVRRDGNKRMMV